VADAAISLALGVGHNPDAIPLMGRTGVSCRYNSPPRIIPQRGNVSKHSVESSNNKHWRVFHKDETGSNFANDSPHFFPKPASLSVKPIAVTGNTDVLTRESPADDINPPPPGLAVKGLHIVPDRERLKDSVSLAGKQDASGIGSKLNSADGAPSKELSAQDASSRPSKKCQLIHLSFVKG
jgi:hypothetical protein